MTTSAGVRQRLVDALRHDLVGPEPGSPHEREGLPFLPSRWYLSGFLIPFEAPESQRRDETEQEELDLVSVPGGGNDEETPERASARKAFFPSSLGLSVLLPAQARRLGVRADWGDYRFVEVAREAGEREEGPSDGAAEPTRGTWQRTPQAREIEVALPEAGASPVATELPDSGGLRIVASVRALGPALAAAGSLPPGAKVASLFLVNERQPSPDSRRDEALAFQAQLSVRSEVPFAARPDLRGEQSGDWDERVADLQYRDALDFAVGHGVATHARVAEDGSCREVTTCWIPEAEVERIEPAAVPGVELGMEALGALPSAGEARDRLARFPAGYGAWIEAQAAALPDPGRRREVAEEMLQRARVAKARIEAGIAELEDAQVLEAFRIANRAMAAAARQRTAQIRGIAPAEVEAPSWRPFQLAFLLMNLRGIARPGDSDREVVDLLFFPTGGGKTEAYLGLAAFTMVLRRLRNPGFTAAGMSVLMRYTLRLLTLDQLGRAATLICALERERKQDVEKLGAWPFEIGLWVGQGGTPNRMGSKGDGDRYSARARTIAFKNDTRKPPPIPLESCPWCGARFSADSFQLPPNADHPTDLRIACVNRRCEFRGDQPLPIVAVDEPLYRRLPAFVIATVDKLASLPWVGPSGLLFGGAERHDAQGFYGPCDPGRGGRLPQPLLPPDLIIQDELHLISGPLGTVAGLYEAAIEALCTRATEGREIRPKVVASTATARRAEGQICALFGRTQVEVFPPPGSDRRDSFFARTVGVEEARGRLYLGVAAQGRSLKVVLLRTYLACLTAAQRAWNAEGGARNLDNPADPYMTVLGYFNSLRELGGSRRIVEDEVTSRARAYGSRTRAGEAEGAFADRKLAYEVLELTSRVPTSDVAEAKRRLSLPFREKERVDVALATNMISVGLDITRLGLMVVLGQPRTTAEYIQATSRVGRDAGRPGLVVTLLNVHRPRDRSHLERFEAYHETFYRGVEAASVTPFSPRAVDRAIAAAAVTLARHGCPGLTAPAAALEILRERPQLDFVSETFGRRAALCDPLLSADEQAQARQKLRGRVNDLLDSWSRIAHQKQQTGAGLQYGREVGGAPPLLFDPLDPELAAQPPDARKFKAHRSMRGVEPDVNLWVRRFDGAEVEPPAEPEP
jgi:hypothetical protein